MAQSDNNCDCKYFCGQADLKMIREWKRSHCRSSRDGRQQQKYPETCISETTGTVLLSEQ
jgi:hypothetical protein